jgi:hypothetical protein
VIPFGVMFDHPESAERGSMTHHQPLQGHGPARYEIVLRGELSDRFAPAFEAMTLEAGGGRTRIVGVVVDQAHLYGLLDRIRDLGMELISVTQTGAEPSE